LDNVLSIREISKSYGNIKILKSIDLNVHKGEIHGLVGANGSGKSTLLNILFGNSLIKNTGGYQGEIFLNEKRIRIKTSEDALNNGIGMIHQESTLISELTVEENIKLGREKVFNLTQKLFGSDLACINFKKNSHEVKYVLESLELKVDPGTYLKQLPLSQKQFIEIAREIDKENLKLLLLDEPTAVLNRQDVQKLFKELRVLAQKGIGMIFVSHRLDEIIELCDRVTVLRDGEITASYVRDEFSPEKIARDMVGHEVVQTKRIGNIHQGAPVLEFKEFSVFMPGEQLENLNLTIYEGEILGITSLSGHGKLAVGNGVMGLYQTTGKILLRGLELNYTHVSEIIAKGISFIPEDRRNIGLLLKHSILDNIIVTAMQVNNSFLFPFFCKSLSWPIKKKAVAHVQACIQQFEVKCNNCYQSVEELSGGNQQKVCIARTLAISPDILFIAEPTRGIDLGAKEIVLDMLVKRNEINGNTIIIASSELDELKRICDRIVVLYEGRVSAVLSPQSDDMEFALAFSGIEKGASIK
jgi:simple sugar transport system ATP-binding protein